MGARNDAKPKRDNARRGGMTKVQQTAARAYRAASPVKPTRQGIAAVRLELTCEPTGALGGWTPAPFGPR